MTYVLELLLLKVQQRCVHIDCRCCTSCHLTWWMLISSTAWLHRMAERLHTAFMRRRLLP